MSLSDERKLVEALERGKLTAAQEAEAEAFLAEHPERRAEWDEELNLNHLLRQISDVPISSNFTARVLEAVRRDAQPRSEGAGWRRLVTLGWMPKLTVAACVACAGLFLYHQHQLAERQELAQNLAEMSRLTSGPAIELLQNFDAIQRLNQVPADVDRELIAALQ